jgi:uncharacterized membrane protein YphA (DoxX/SURF4 family)
MKTLLVNEYFVLVLRIVLGLAFITASIEKIADPTAFANSIGNYKLISPSVALIAASFLPWIELLSGLALLFGLFTRGSSFLIFIMLVVFTGGVISAVLRGLDISCGCFTQDPSVGKVGWLKVGENLAMILGSLFLFLSTNTRFSVEHYFRTPPMIDQGEAPTSE